MYKGKLATGFNLDRIRNAFSIIYWLYQNLNCHSSFSITKLRLFPKLFKGVHGWADGHSYIESDSNYKSIGIINNKFISPPLSSYKTNSQSHNNLCYCVV